MLKERRQQAILDEVQRTTGAVTLHILAERLDTTYATIRRDVDSLAAQGLLHRVHGGVLKASDRPLRQAPPTSVAWAIASHALRLIAPGSCVGLTGGATTTALASLLRQVPDLTIVTNSIPVYRATVHDASTVILIGGIRSASGSNIGPLALSTIGALRFDLLFMHAEGIHKVHGLTHADVWEAACHQALHLAASASIALAETGAWQRHCLRMIVPYQHLSTVITPGRSGAMTALIPGESPCSRT